MGTINTKLNNLKESDMWNFILFTLFKLRELPEYSAISELAYVLDKQNLINLCEYFGGLTVTIPTIDDLEITIQALLVYQYVECDHVSFEEAIKKLNTQDVNYRKIKNTYLKIKELLTSYSFKSRG